MTTHYHNSVVQLKIKYFQANRCWRSNNLKSCLLICDELSARLNSSASSGHNHDRERARLKNLLWFLKIRCLVDDYHVNESLLLNEEDIEGDDQVRTYSTAATRTSTNATRRTSRRASGGPTDRVLATGGTMESRKTAILTGKMSSVTSRHSGRATSSYRPLTTSLTATQTAFSRSTRPILKYSTHCFLSKPLYEYLYNAQRATNKCPDYRQCLEYLNLVRNINHRTVATVKRRDNSKRATSSKQAMMNDSQLVLLEDDGDDSNNGESSDKELRSLGAFWLLTFGICYYNLHMNKQAEEFFKLALAVNARNLDSYAWLIKVYLRSNQPGKVLKTCEEGLTRSRNPILYNWKARIQALIYNSFAANLSLRESLRYYPTNIEALANVGYFSFYSDKLEQALRCFERIDRLTVNQLGGQYDLVSENLGSNAELLNNLALCNFYNGKYHKVLPLFQRAILSSPSKEVTSDIWYNLSFIPMCCGLRNLAMACLRLALKSDSQNEEAINNLGVLRYGSILDEDLLDYANRQEYWSQAASSAMPSKRSNSDPETKLVENLTDEQRKQYQLFYDEVETYFTLSKTTIDTDDQQATDVSQCLYSQPEMLYNMAVIKRRRGQLLASQNYCKRYLELDPNNYAMRSLIQDIEQLVSHDT